MDISLARKTEIYFIIERLFPRDHLVPGTLTLGLISPSITQIHRTVIRLMVKQNMYMDGERIHPGDISLWQRVKYLFGSVVSTKDTENFVYHLAYSGSLIAATPFPASAIIDIPKRLTTPIIKQVPGYMTMGTDPIPNITLYNKENINFLWEMVELTPQQPWQNTMAFRKNLTSSMIKLYYKTWCLSFRNKEQKDEGNIYQANEFYLLYKDPCMHYILKTLIKACTGAMDCYGQDTKLEYLVIAIFQCCWYFLYLYFLSDDTWPVVLTGLFIVPLISSSLRCLNTLKRSRMIGFLWLISPYIMLFLPLLLSPKKNQHKAWSANRNCAYSQNRLTSFVEDFIYLSQPIHAYW